MGCKTEIKAGEIETLLKPVEYHGLSVMHLWCKQVALKLTDAFTNAKLTYGSNDRFSVLV